MVCVRLYGRCKRLDDCGSGVSHGFRTFCQSPASPRTLKVLGATGVAFPLLGNKQLPHLSDLKYSFPRFLLFSFLALFPRFGWFDSIAWLRRVQRSPCPAGRHKQLAPTAPVFTPPSHSSNVRSVSVRARPKSYRRVLHHHMVSLSKSSKLINDCLTHDLCLENFPTHPPRGGTGEMTIFRHHIQSGAALQRRFVPQYAVGYQQQYVCLLAYRARLPARSTPMQSRLQVNANALTGLEGW